MAKMFLTKCPLCGTALNLKDSDDMIGKILTCPACKEKVPYSKFKRLKVQSDTETVLAKPSAEYFVSLVDVNTGKRYPVPQGESLIGRKTYKTAPTADVPVETEDMGFSRSHFNLLVAMGSDGMCHVYISNAQNKNKTSVNGIPLEGEDTIAIRNGDTISSSKTKLRLEINKEH